MIINENNKLTEDGLRWSRVVEEDLTELIKEMRKANMPYEDISHLLLLGISDSMTSSLMDEYCDKK